MSTLSYADQWSWLGTCFKRKTEPPEKMPPRRTYTVALILSLMLGWTGIDRFYLGKIGTGILKMLTFGGLGIWWLIDLFLLVRGKSHDVLGQPLEDAKTRDSTLYTLLTVYGAGLGMHYLYLDLGKLALTRLCVSILFIIIHLWHFSASLSFQGAPFLLRALYIFMLLVVIIWSLLDLYMAVTGRVSTTASGEPLLPPKKRYQSVALLLSIFGGLLGIDRFYLGHRVLGLLKLFTLGGFFLWYLLDIVLVYINANKDVNGEPLVQE